MIAISPLEMEVKNNKNQIKKSIAINEVSILRQSRQTVSLAIYNKKKHVIKKLVADGVLVSTPAGSTAYNLSVNGPILSLNSKHLAITPISPFRPRRWRGALIKNNAIIEFNVINPKMRPVSASADAFEVKNISKVSISQKNDINLRILYDKTNSMEDKYLREQFSIG